MLGKLICNPNSIKLHQLTTSLINLNIQQTRYIRVRKPPWIPRSKAKAFRVPPLYEPDPDETAFITPIIRNYKAQMRSIYQLFKTENKFSDKASLKAQEEQQRKMEEEKVLLELNDKRNADLLAEQLLDEEKKLDLKKKQLEQKLNEQQNAERAYVQLADEKVRKLKEKVKTFIDPNNLEFEIEKMLNERNDYNFSINTSGLMFKSGVAVNRHQAFDTKLIEPTKSVSSALTSTAVADNT